MARQWVDIYSNILMCLFPGKSIPKWWQIFLTTDVHCCCKLHLIHPIHTSLATNSTHYWSAAHAAASFSVRAQNTELVLSCLAGLGLVYAGGTWGAPLPLPCSVLPHCRMMNLSCHLLCGVIGTSVGCCDDLPVVVDNMSNYCMDQKLACQDQYPDELYQLFLVMTHSTFTSLWHHCGAITPLGSAPDSWNHSVLLLYI